MGVVASSPYDWSPERVEAAVSLWRAGRSASEVARALGGGVTRNAVLGKLLRMGELKRSEQKPAEPRCTKPPGTNQYGEPKCPRADRTPSQKVGPREAAIVGRVAADVAARRAENKTPAAPINVTHARTFIQLKNGQCKWPLDMSVHVLATGQSLFCGAPVRDIECVYCAAHAKAAYVKAPATIRTEPVKDMRRFNGRRVAGLARRPQFAE